MKRPKLGWEGANKIDRMRQHGSEPVWVGLQGSKPEKVTWVDLSKSGWNSGPKRLSIFKSKSAKQKAEDRQRRERAHNERSAIEQAQEQELARLSVERARQRELARKEKRARKQEQREAVAQRAAERARAISKLPQKRKDALDKLLQQISSTRPGRS